MLEKTLESLLDSKEIKQVNLKGKQPWIFIGRTHAEAPTLWPPDVKSWLIGKDLDAGKDWRQKEKAMTEDEMVGWHQQLDGHEFEQTLGDPGVLQSMGFQRAGHGWSNLACTGHKRKKEMWRQKQELGMMWGRGHKTKNTNNDLKGKNSRKSFPCTFKRMMTLL